MKNFRQIIVCKTALLVLLAAAPGMAGSDNFPGGILSDAWYIVRYNGVKVGYAHETVERREQEMVTTMVTLLELKVGFGTHIRMRDTTETVETLSGKPLRFSKILARAQPKTIIKQDPDNPSRFTGTIRLGDTEEPYLQIRGLFKNGHVTVTHEQYSSTYESHFDVDPDTVMSWGKRRNVIKNNHVNEPFESKEFNIDNPAHATLSLGRVVGQEKITLSGTSHLAIKVVEEKPVMRTTLTIWYDEKGVLLRSLANNILGTSVEIVRCRHDEALAENGFLTEVVNRSANLDQFVDFDNSQQITYRLSATDDNIHLPSIPDTGTQRVVVQPDGSALITVTRFDVNQEVDDDVTSNSLAMKPYLQPTWQISSDDPMVIQAAAKASVHELNDVIVARKLWSYVHQNISGAMQSSGPPSAAEVIRTKQGVCTAHAVLLAAMARARGIPARLVGGLASTDALSAIYYSGAMPTGSSLFGHQWVQLYLRGRWIDVDSTLDQPFPNPDRIATYMTPDQSRSNEQNETLSDLLLAGKIKLEVVHVEPLANTLPQKHR